jgi:GNAT superfamily N-acetyltransferase
LVRGRIDKDAASRSQERDAAFASLARLPARTHDGWHAAGQWGVVIRDAEAAELPVLQGIDVATGQMFRDIGMPEVAEYDPWPLPDLEHSRAAGLLWVIPGEAGQPVAFLMGGQVDGCLHVEQLSVDMGSARRGLGRTLLEHAARRARPTGCPR